MAERISTHLHLPKPNDKESNTKEAMFFEAYANQLKEKYEGGVDRGRRPPASQALTSFHLNRVPTVYYRYNLTGVGTRLQQSQRHIAIGCHDKAESHVKKPLWLRNHCFLRDQSLRGFHAGDEKFRGANFGHNLSVLTTPPGKLQYYWVTGEAETIAHEDLACHNKGILEEAFLTRPFNQGNLCFH